MKEFEKWWIKEKIEIDQVTGRPTFIPGPGHKSYARDAWIAAISLKKVRKELKPIKPSGKEV